MLEESSVLCEICLENYDKGIKQPKILECCGKEYCLKCLSDIYRIKGAKIICPICRKQTTKNPNDLKTDNSVFQGKLKCQKCSKSVKISDLKLVLWGRNKPLIACVACYPAPEVDFLNNTLPYLTEEMALYINRFSPLSKDVLNETINSRIISFVDSLLEKLRKGLVIKIRQKVASNLEKTYGANFKQSIAQFILDYGEFQKQYSKIKPLTTSGVEIQSSDFSNIVEAIDFYKQKIESIQKNGITLQKISELITADFYYSVNERISLDEIENFFTKIVSIGGPQKSVYQNPSDFDYSTGITYYDSKNKAIQSEIKLNLSLIDVQKNEIYKLNSMLLEYQKTNTNLMSRLSQQPQKQFQVQRYGFSIASSRNYSMVDINECSREQDLFGFEFDK